MKKTKIVSSKKTKAEIEDILNECRVQLTHIQAIYPTGTSANVISRLETFIHEYKKEAKND